jgi:glutamate-1-semialdehyde 2,1-aminomutase
MQQIAPAGPVYQAGTLSGNPLAMTAGLAMLQTLAQPGVFAAIADTAAALVAAIEAAAQSHGIPIQAGWVGTMFGFYFLKAPRLTITDYASAKAHADTVRYGRFFHAMLDRGVYFAPSQFEAAFVSSAHTAADIQTTLAAVQDVFGLLGRS